jgi:predicted ABC-type sugar transport system permease subunit
LDCGAHHAALSLPPPTGWGDWIVLLGALLFAVHIACLGTVALGVEPYTWRMAIGGAMIVICVALTEVDFSKLRGKKTCV